LHPGNVKWFEVPEINLWLQADLKPTEIDFRFALNFGNSRGLG